MKCKDALKNEDGSTLIETLIATVILVSVLLPAGMFLGYIANNPQNKLKILALSLAQSEMEEVLNEKNYTGYEKEVEDTWIIKNNVTTGDDLVHLEISVYRKNKPEPIVTLTTERLFYEAAPEK